MKTLIDEKTEYQQYFIEKLKEVGYLERSSKQFYDKRYAMDTEELLSFLDDTQPEEMAQLRKIHGDSANDIIIAKINQEILSSGLLEVFKSKNGVEINGVSLKLIFNKPATSFNETLESLYNKNRFTVMQEVVISDSERIDLVLFVNGLAVVTCELKSEYSRQTYRNAIDQYSYNRDPNNRLFKFKSGAVVNFAMDLNNVFMTTKLDNEKTTFLPFNRGSGEGVKTGAGNPIDDGSKDYPVHYMWDDVLVPDSLIELLTNFCFTIREEKKNPETGEKTLKESLIFPRYHQRDAVKKLLDDTKKNKSTFNYLIQHSAGSGKTNTICWLAHRLSSLHDSDDKQIFDNVLIITDRLVVDQQLQKAVKSIDHQPGLIRAIGEEQGDDSSVLRDALKGNTKIIVTTIQKFLYLDFNELAAELKDKHFAVIIDEAHSSTSGKDMAAVQNVLGAKQTSESDDEEIDEEALLEAELTKNGKQQNVSVFAFTATPKPTTIQLFGTDKLTPEGDVRKSAFHLYSMKQAIEEGFILDVLNNYMEYETFYKVLKSSADDPTLKTADAKKQIYRVAMMNPENIEQRIEIILTHFRDNVCRELDGQAKAMIVTNWREEAVRYYFALKKYLDSHNITDIKPLVAFTGKVHLNDKEFTEYGINGISEDKLPDHFNLPQYNVLLVANKYQTGFDQPKLCAMYILKPLNGVNAVQTLSRLNRTCAPYQKKTFVLDFVNTYQEMEDAFAPYYTTTILKNSASVSELRDKAEEIDGYGVITDYDVDQFFKIVYGTAAKDAKGLGNLRSKTAANADANVLIRRAIQMMNNMFGNEPEKQKEFIGSCRSYVRLYDFLSLITGQIDSELYKKYLFISTFLTNIEFGTNNGIDISKKVNMTEFKNIYSKTHESSGSHVSKPFVSLPSAEVKLTKDEEQLLSDIIDEINAASGLTFDTDVATKAMLQIKDLLLKNENLKTGARNNNEQDFGYILNDDADEALLDGLTSNNEFFSLLLNDEDLKKKVLSAFKHSVYEELRKD